MGILQKTGAGIPVLFPGGRVERILLSYLLLLNCALLVWRPRGLWLSAVALHCVMAAVILGLTHAARRRTSGILHFLFHWYPQLCFLFFFEEVELLVHIIHPGWFDRYIVQFDLYWFRVHPTLWLEQYAGPWLTEIMQGCYFSYYLTLPGVGGLLYFRSRRQEFELLMTASAVGYAACYGVFYLFPVEGPYHTLAACYRGELSGGFFHSLMAQIERFGRVHGGAFPSTHVVGTFVSWLTAWRYLPKLAWGMTPFVAGMLIATIYGRYHYVADVLAGIVVAFVAFEASRRFPPATSMNYR
jgi:membrane-associated phospholipid phosphatase